MNPTQRLGTGRSSTFVDNGGGGEIELVETKLLLGDETDVDFTGLDGDTDLIYILSLSLIVSNATSGAGCNPGLRFNGAADDTGLSSSWVYEFASAALGTDFSTGAVIHFKDGATPSVVSTIKLFAKSGVVRNGTFQSGDSGDRLPVNGNLLWTNTADNMTQITLHSPSAGRIGAGSRLSLYRMRNG